MNNSPQRAAKGFTRAFWVSNTVELFERMAYYAVFIVLTIYLSTILGFNDFEASMISGLFSGGLYLLPIFSGAYADKIGFRKSMIIAFSLLSIGYLGLGVLPTLLETAGLVSYGVTTQFNGLPDNVFTENPDMPKFICGEIQRDVNHLLDARTASVRTKSRTGTSKTGTKG